MIEKLHENKASQVALELVTSTRKSQLLFSPTFRNLRSDRSGVETTAASHHSTQSMYSHVSADKKEVSIPTDSQHSFHPFSTQARTILDKKRARTSREKKPPSLSRLLAPHNIVRHRK
jgi:hypothetical protein